MKKPLFYLITACAIGALLWITFRAKDMHAEHNGPVFTDSAPQPIGPYSQAVMRGNALFVSGQVGMDPATGILDTSSIEVETKQAMENIAAILRSAKMEMSNIAKTTIYLTDLNDFKAVNEVYGSYFGKGPYPARETVQVAGLPKGAHIEISVTAIR